MPTVLDLNDKTGWCKYAVHEEELFVFLYGSRLNLRMNPAKAENQYAPDLLWNHCTPAELKIRKTPLFIAGRYKLDPQYAVTINLKDIDRYQEKYPSMPIYFWVWWHQLEGFGRTVKPMQGVWGIYVQDLVKLCTEDRVIEYEKRRMDTLGNAKSSYVISVTKMKELFFK
jgi:hypothetical protein